MSQNRKYGQFVGKRLRFPKPSLPDSAINWHACEKTLAGGLFRPTDSDRNETVFVHRGMIGA